MAKKKVKLTVYLDRDVRFRIYALAKELDCTYSDVANGAFRDAFEQYDFLAFLGVTPKRCREVGRALERLVKAEFPMDMKKAQNA